SAMQGARPDRLWAASLLSAACGLIAFAVLAVGRDRAAARFGATVVQQRAEPAHFSLRRVPLEILAIAALVALLVGAWWAWIELADVSPLVVPRPSAVWDDLRTNPGDYASATGATLLTAAIALAIGAGVGLIA